MICYRDMTFCNSTTHRPECSRQLTDEVRAAAVKWWCGPEARPWSGLSHSPSVPVWLC